MTAAIPLILRGNLSIGVASANVDVSDEILSFKITGKADTVQVPATLGVAKRNLGGGASYEIEIGYLSADGTNGLVLPMFWDALITATKELFFAGNLRDGANSAANPRWTGKFVVGAAEVGGDAEALSSADGTFMMTGAPVQVIV